jgi:hypothetical protein
MFKKGDEVVTLKDMSKKLKVVEVKIEKVEVPAREAESGFLWNQEARPAYTRNDEYVEVENHKIYKAEELSLYSPALASLQKEIQSLKRDLNSASGHLRQRDEKDECEDDD